MKCGYCGYEIPEGELYCGNCGREVFIVPDYNPLEDMLTAQIKVAVNNEEDSGSDYLSDITEDMRSRTTSRRNTSGHMQDTSARRNRNTGRNTETNRSRNTARNMNRNTSRSRNAGREQAERERRRRQAEYKKEKLRKKRRNVIITFLVIATAAAAGGFYLYQNSYSGIINKGYKAFENKEYHLAADYFKRAAAKNEKKADAYIGLSKVYIQQERLEEAEGVFDSAIAKQPENADIYEAYIGYYIDTKQEMSIPLLLDDAKDKVREKLKEYIIPEPEYDLNDEEIYDDVQQLEISSGENTVYYTADGTEPDMSSSKYTGPIQLEEGKNVIRAVAVDKRGIPSMTVEKTYVVEFPVEDAPAVSPSTGQYDTAQQIEVKVPEGYEAYYTMDGQDPTTASVKYTGPVEMPEGEILFKAILVNSSGRTSGVTTRNYMLDTHNN